MIGRRQRCYVHVRALLIEQGGNEGQLPGERALRLSTARLKRRKWLPTMVPHAPVWPCCKEAQATVGFGTMVGPDLGDTPSKS